MERPLDRTIDPAAIADVLAISTPFLKKLRVREECTYVADQCTQLKRSDP
jgi:hypothetical protein